MIFLLPCETLNLRKVDFDFQREYTALCSLGFRVYLFDHDQFVSYNDFVSDFDFRTSTDTVVLRSWMLKKEQYESLYSILSSKGFNLINNPSQYLNCHYYPMAFPSIKDYVCRSTWFTDISEESVKQHRGEINGDIIIKDYVKSEKYNSEIFQLPYSLSDYDFYHNVLEFKSQRGRLFNEGIVFKEVVDLKKYGDKTNEFRVFVMNGRVLSVFQNSDLGYGQKPDLSILDIVVPNIDSNFFTIDLAEKSDGTWMILECGDGGVSGLSPGQSETLFYVNFTNKEEIEE